MPKTSRTKQNLTTELRKIRKKIHINRSCHKQNQLPIPTKPN